ncbi:MAG TPA: transglycosylase domain-containing protein [Burkholderiales bacterium]|nr:transglycosylase domain-containing protein [Burkholderiales bacterium]
MEKLRRFVAWARLHPFQALLLLPTLVLLYVLLLIPFTPSIQDLRKAKSATPSVVISSDGVVLAEFKRVNREWVPLEKIAPSVIDALIATEDHRFYDHHGLDLRRTAGALLNTLKGDLQGGSTLTQQLARNLYPEEIGRAATLTRKIKEAITALKIEAVYTKREILETYLNTVPFLFNAFGIEMAARTYFDKSAAELEVLEAATLIGMLKATSAFNPVLNPDRARQRRNVVLAQMAKHGKLTPAQLAALSKRPLKLDFERQSESLGPAPHIAQYLRKWLIEWADPRDYDIYSDGLVVRTTIDSRLQNAANRAVARQMKQLQPLADREVRRSQETSVLQAGFMAMDPGTGAVRAWVGSRDFAEEQFDHVAQARRQPGSAFKPFVYGAAFIMGMPPDMTLVDEPVRIPLGGGQFWEPTDMSPPTYETLTLRDGLAFSKNTITAQVMHKVGPQRVVRLAQALGVRQSKLEPVPSLALGTSPVTLREMVGAYGAIANGGHFVEPMIVNRVEDRTGRVLAQFQPLREVDEAMPRAHSLELVNAMRGVIDEGTGASIRSRYGITADVAGKTGTTQENTDGWFIMMHPQLVAGARVGFNDKLTMGSWGQGARSALPIVGEVFQQALRRNWIDQKAEFDIPRQRPRPPEPEQVGGPEWPASWPRPEEVINNAVERLREIFR